MRHYFRHKNGYITVTADYLYISTKEKDSDTSKSFFRKNRFLFWVLYFAIIFACVWVHSLLLLALLTAVLGVNNLSPEKIRGYKISVDKILSIDKTGNAVILKFHDEKGDIVVQKIRKINQDGYKALEKLI